MTGEEIAIIGISGKFPGAKNIDQFWDNLKNGVESISFIPEKEIKENQKTQNYVACKGGELEEKEYFDASFFGYSPREAELMDPQIRIFHECVWEVLEDAAYCSEIEKNRVGLYAGASDNFHWKANAIIQNKTRDNFSLGQLIDKDFICSRVSYNLNLKGPVFTVQTACSTSLVAVHLACQGLLNGECDMALAGGIAIGYGNENGYYHLDGSILSADGHCRPFDKNANGTVPGSGVGVIALKMLDSAIKDNDNIYAIIKGSAINNDGSDKIGYTAPSIFGQINVIKKSMQIAEVKPESIGYIEAHGTGTELGDPIEIEALSHVFNSNGSKNCGLGSLKGNIGHLDTAAGVAGIIKVALSLKNKTLIPSINFNQPNPKINFENTSLYIVDKLKKWERNGNKPLIAGISSFGIGGTNAHVILEEYIEQPTEFKKRDENIFIISAKNTNVLDSLRKKYIQYLNENDSVSLDDMCYTLSVGRKMFKERFGLRFKSKAELINKLNENFIHDNFINKYDNINKRLVFMFPGQGAQYLNMGRELYHKEKEFQKILSSCFKIFKKVRGFDLQKIVFAENYNIENEINKLNSTDIVQPLLFILEYSLGKYLEFLGVRPNVMVGHSIGEYVAACLADVFSFEDGLKIVCKRGELMNQMPKGSMLSIQIHGDELDKYIKDGLSIAAINTQNSYVVSGNYNKILELEKLLKSDNYPCKLLNVSHAFHSGMMEPILKEFSTFLGTFSFNTPKIDFISNVTGELITKNMATSHEYWSNHIISTVNFSKSIEFLLSTEANLLIEVGPGNTLTSFVRKNKLYNSSHKVINLLKHFNSTINDQSYFYDQLAELWMNGVNVNFKNLYIYENRKRLSLPSYPFERRKYWPKEFRTNVNNLFTNKEDTKIQEKDGLYYTPIWEQYFTLNNNHRRINANVLVFSNENPITIQVCSQLKEDGCNIIRVKNGVDFKDAGNNEFYINPEDEGNYYKLFEVILDKGLLPDRIVHFWSVTDKSDKISLNRFKQFQKIGFYNLIYLVQAYGKLGISKKTELNIVTNNLFEVVGGEVLYPDKAPLLAISKIIPVEYDTFSNKFIEFSLFDNINNQLVNNIVEEIIDHSNEKIIALRGKKKWIQKFKSVDLAGNIAGNTLIKERGIYLITGGTGGMGSSISRYLANQFNATVIVVSRSGNDIFNIIENSITDEEIDKRKSLLNDVVSQQGKIIVKKGDISNLEDIKQIIDDVEETYGQINGVMHAAATIDTFGVIQRRKPKEYEESMSAKTYGLLVLNEIFNGKKLDFLVNFSSLGTILYDSKFGESGYVAANEFLDSFTLYSNSAIDTKFISINWCDWKQVGMSERTIKKMTFKNQEISDRIAKEFELSALSPTEGVDVFNQIINSNLSRVVLCKTDLNAELKEVFKRLQIKKMLYSIDKEKYMGTVNGFLKDSSNHIKKEYNLENEIKSIWQEYLGYDDIKINDNIFELGANSLDVVQINQIVKSNLNINLPVVTYYEYPTIRSFINFLQKQTPGDIKEDEFNCKMKRGIQNLKKLNNLSKIKD